MNTSSTLLYFNLIIIFLFAVCSGDQEIITTNNYHHGLQLAADENKRILLLFTGNSCLNNIKLQEKISSNSQLTKELNDNFINVHLYVDDRTPLPEEIKASYSEGDRFSMIKNYGNHWAYIQKEKYNSNMQPLLFIIDKDENILKGPIEFKEAMQSLESIVQTAML